LDWEDNIAPCVNAPCVGLATIHDGKHGMASAELRHYGEAGSPSEAC
jgi:hypothetical protein